MFWNIVASVGAKYIIESHLSADRWSLTNNIFPELDEVFLCTRYGIRKLENREVDSIFQQSKNEIRTVVCALYIDNTFRACGKDSPDKKPRVRLIYITIRINQI